MLNENPEINREINPQMPEKAGPEVYRAWSTKAEKEKNADVVAREMARTSPDIHPVTTTPEAKPSDKVLAYIEELKTSRDPVVTLNQWMVDVKDEKKDPFEVAEAMSWTEEQKKDLPN